MRLGTQVFRSTDSSSRGSVSPSELASATGRDDGSAGVATSGTAERPISHSAEAGGVCRGQNVRVPVGQEPGRCVTAPSPNPLVSLDLHRLDWVSRPLDTQFPDRSVQWTVGWRSRFCATANDGTIPACSTLRGGGFADHRSAHREDDLPVCRPQKCDPVLPHRGASQHLRAAVRSSRCSGRFS